MAKAGGLKAAPRDVDVDDDDEEQDDGEVFEGSGDSLEALLEKEGVSVLNLNEVDENAVREYRLWPSGDYLGVIKKLEITKSKKGDPMLKWTTTATDESTGDHRNFFFYIVLTQEGALQRLKRILLDVAPDLVKDGLGIQELCVDIREAPCTLAITQEPDYKDNKKTRNTLSAIKSPSGATSRFLDPD